MKLHLIGICGTGMGSLAGLLKADGHDVRGSDEHIYPPMSDQLAAQHIPVFDGFRAENLAWEPDCIVVGNVCRRDHVEVLEAARRGVQLTSFPAALEEHFLTTRVPLVVAGTHGKTTTTSIAAAVFTAAGTDPGYLIGGVPLGFAQPFRAGAVGAPFIVEGDEYDTAFFDKGPKFLHYQPNTAIITSVEFDHADIYRDLDHVKESFQKLVAIVPPSGEVGHGGCIVARWDHDNVVDVCADAVARREAGGPGPEIRRYGVGQQWDGRIDRVDTRRGVQHFTVLRDGAVWGAFECILVGEYNLYNCVAACAALDREGLTAAQLAPGFASFAGVKRRQEVVGEARQVTVLDDFAHHPTAVEVTLSGLRLRFGNRRIWAIFEPRSATSRRAVFQEAYASAFADADVVVVAAPPDQGRIPEAERFDTPRLIRRLREKGKEAFTWDSVDEIVAAVCANALPHDVVAVLSNGAFGGIHQKLLAGLGRE